MKIEPIIYETTRGIYSIEYKLSIATLILFCWKLGNKTFSELLYTDNLESFISILNEKYKDYEIDLSVKLDDKQIKTALIKTIEEVKKKEDKDGFLKALYEGDEFAIVIYEILNYNFDKLNIKELAHKINQQLKLF